MVFCLGSPLHAQPGITQALENSVLLTAQAASGSITLTAPAFTGTVQYKVYRKLRSTLDFPGSPLATIPVSGNTALNYVDNGTGPNVLYEYKVVRSSSSGTGYGYVCSGWKVPASAWTGNADHYMGKVLVFVESGLAGAIAPQVDQLMRDLKAEGWVALKNTSFNSSGDPDAVHAAIVSAHAADPANVKAVLLIGQVPIPLTQNNGLDPDGHNDNSRLWPVDGYYGDMDGNWTKYNSGPYAGLFAIASFPSDIELAVGRVDLSDLPSFAMNEAQLTAAYLQRDHDFRTRAFTPKERGILFDNLYWTGNAFTSSGWKTMAATVGNAVDDASPDQPLPNSGIYQAWPSWYPFAGYVDQNGTTGTSANLVNEGSWLWTCIGGGESLTSTGNTGSTAEYAQPGFRYGGIFNMGFGSYYGRWNTTDNVLRSPLAAGALTNVWSGKPHWYFHNMAMGETIGRSTLQTWNNTDARYTPQNSSGSGDAPNIHMCLMGDPTLRMRAVAPPAGLQATVSGNQVSFTWSASVDPAVAGYNIYAFNGAGVPDLLNTATIAGTSWNYTGSFPSGTEFMVRAVKLETTPSGSWWNLSAGALTVQEGGTVMAKLKVKMMLGGPYNQGSGQMNDALRHVPAFPLTEPYTGLGGELDPMGGGGETTTAAVLAVGGNNAIVDWVLVELRSNGDPSQVVESRCGLVQRDGDVVAANDGVSPLRFNSQGQFRVAVRHRNHLGCMTSTAITLAAGTPATVDFTAPSTETYGTQARKDVGGTLVLWPGNVQLADREVKFTGTDNDRDPVLVSVGGSMATVPNMDVYALEDVNLDGNIKYVGAENDLTAILNSTDGTVPTAIRTEQLP